MGVGKGLENKLEGLVEGFFTRAFRSGLQPVEVGRRIIREMGDNKTVSVNRVYAPNEFSVVMGSDDLSRFSQMKGGLEKEFTELIIDAAKQNRWNLMGLPKIDFREDETMGKGEFKVESTFGSPADQPNRVSTHEPDEDAAAPSAVSSHTAEKMGLAASAPQLLVLDGDGKPSERISLTRDPVVIGRLSSNDVVLSDSNVSRRHAELTCADGRWILSDLGSTNGSMVNGRMIKEHPLADGDRLAFGTSELIFKESGGS
jgi:hypothetical protein